MTKAFLFDLDGTLIDSEMLWIRAIVEWLGDCGAHTTIDHIAQLAVGHSWPDINRALHNEFPQLTNATPEEDAHELRPYYARIATDPSQLAIPSSVTFFKRCAQHARCAIVSGSPHRDVEDAAQMIGIANQVELIMGAEDYERGKPFPDGFLAAAQKLNLTPDECIVVEDSTAGVRSALAAGMRVIALSTNHAAQQNLAGATWIVENLEDWNEE